MDTPVTVTRAKIIERITEMMREGSFIEKNETVNPDHDFVDNMGLDSLDRVEIVMGVEDEFGIDIPDDDAVKLVTQAKIADYLITEREIRL